eukprot:3537726-Prymnesium_polylepis.1
MLVAQLFSILAAPPEDWRFLDRYPRHYRTPRLPQHVPPPVLDGIIDDAVCWATRPPSRFPSHPPSIS